MLLGIILLISGIILSIYEETETQAVFGAPIQSKSNPFQFIGFPMIIIGMTCSATGGYWLTRPQKELSENNIRGGKAYSRDPKLTNRLCWYCQRWTRKDYDNCMWCGKPKLRTHR